MTPENDTDRAIAEEALKYRVENKMIHELEVVGADATASMTWRSNVFLLEEFVKKLFSEQSIFDIQRNCHYDMFSPTLMGKVVVRKLSVVQLVKN